MQSRHETRNRSKFVGWLRREAGLEDYHHPDFRLWFRAGLAPGFGESQDFLPSYGSAYVDDLGGYKRQASDKLEVNRNHTYGLQLFDQFNIAPLHLQ